MEKAITEFIIKRNGKPQIKISKKLHSTYGFMSGNPFSSKEGNIFINELKVNSIKRTFRKFIISIRNIGTGKNEGEYRIQQLNLDESELLELRNSIDILLNHTNS